MTVAALAARLGVSAQTAHNWLVAADVPRRASPATVRVDVSDVEVRRLYELEGWTAAEVAAHLGCGTSTVYARLQGLGVARRPARPRRSSRPADTELRRLYLENGLGLRQLAERFSVSPQAVSGWLDAAGVPRRGPAPATPPASSDAMAALYHQGWSGPRIAARFGCSTATVYRRLEAAGVSRRRPSPAVDRPSLREALDADLSAPDIAARFEVSVSAVCRASPCADGATVERLRRRLRPRRTVQSAPDPRPSDHRGWIRAVTRGSRETFTDGAGY
ncbi:MAG: helix-turn-helix domain-containing protein [Acidimicrobiales bacterium]